MAIKQTTDADFVRDVEQAEGLVIVDFWAEWCHPCRMIAPILEQLDEEYAGRIQVVKLNVDENPDTPSRFGIMGIPTLLFFKNGEVVERIVGFQPKPNFVRAIEKHLA
ncbi:thioredoxin [Hydrogenibacillus schlegelii]|uniref:Thioredoxin n=1 Tax=Hydrogenibacillus schlegelii TaxID=1484 RepID=A0A132NBZ6_HYDSH|nr:thioredoxin [Hydrogenibacillus schlegelii]KWX07665.1 thioredoxin [Hydrogenibacillus schlegelii]OAR05588.1 thioredoxin [Hydrogenibacillus schlegelii]